ncbi:MAG: antibiotic biosynthesis monooxygenase [Acidimicrobiales bacterium]
MPDAPETPFAPGQVVTVFRSRRRAGTEEEYDRLSEVMLAAARAAPGFVDFSTYAGDDGERVSIVTFASHEAHAAWRDDPGHHAARRRGRDELYGWYCIQVTTCDRVVTWERPAG